jgi:hypothetical protein
MKYIIRFESYSEKDRLDDILDKINKSGKKSLTDYDLKFLNSWKDDNQADIHHHISEIESNIVFEDDNGYFKFEYKEQEDYGDEKHYIGTLYVPDLEWEDGKKIEGILKGKIVKYDNGMISPDFNSEDGYDIFDFCNGLEYELDSFINSIIDEIDEKNNYIN